MNLIKAQYSLSFMVFCVYLVIGMADDNLTNQQLDHALDHTETTTQKIQDHTSDNNINDEAITPSIVEAKGGRIGGGGSRFKYRGRGGGGTRSDNQSQSTCHVFWCKTWFLVAVAFSALCGVYGCVWARKRSKSKGNVPNHKWWLKG